MADYGALTAEFTLDTTKTYEHNMSVYVTTGEAVDSSRPLVVDWGDGVTENLMSGGSGFHTYDVDGIYVVKLYNVSGCGVSNNILGDAQRASKAYTKIKLYEDYGSIVKNYGFYTASNITEIEFQSNLTAIGMFSFNGCSSLMSLTIPSSLTFVGNSAFFGCSNLTDIYYNGTNEQWNILLNNVGSNNSRFTSAAVHIVKTLTYDTNGGTLEEGFDNPTFASDFPDPLPTVELDDYEFGGWYTDNNFTTPIVAGSAIPSSMTIYAKLYNTITYNLDGGTNNSLNKATYTSADVDNNTLVYAPMKAGYNFAGWYSDSSFTTLVEDMGDFDGSAVTLYAKFEEQIVYEPKEKTAEGVARKVPMDAQTVRGYDAFINVNLSSLTTMNSLYAKITDINAKNEHAYFDASSFIDGAYVCLIKMYETGTTRYCEVVDLLGHRTYYNPNGYALNTDIDDYIASCVTKDNYENIKVDSSVETMGDLEAFVNKVNAHGDHVFFDLSDIISNAYVCTVLIMTHSAVKYCFIFDILNGRVYGGYHGYSESTIISDFIALYSDLVHAIRLVSYEFVSLADIVSLINRVNILGHHVLIDPSEFNIGEYMATVTYTTEGSNTTVKISGLVSGKINEITCPTANLGDYSTEEFLQGMHLPETACDVEIITLNDNSTTMADIEVLLDDINSVGRHVFFDTSFYKSMMYLVTIYCDKQNKFCRISDLVTGIEKRVFYKGTDLLKDILNTSSSSGKHYTFVWDKVNAKGTRLNDASNITTTTTNFGHFGSVNTNKDNPFDSIYPWSERKLCNVDLDAYSQLTAGDDITDCVTAWEGDDNFDYNDECGVWVYTPAFFGRSFEAGSYRYFDVTDELTQGNISYPAMITGRWHGCRKTLTIGGVSTANCFVPLADTMPSKSYAMSTMHSEAKKYNGQIVDIYQLDASLLLMVVEYATMNSQTAIGNGVSSLYTQSGYHLLADVSASDTITVTKSVAGNVIPGAIIDIGTSDGGTQAGSFYVVSTSDSGDVRTVTLDRAVTATTAHFWSIHGKINTKDDAIGSDSGYIGSDGKSIAYYRGEELYANLWQYILGAYRQQNTEHIWVCERGHCNEYDALNTTVHIDTGLKLPATGYVKSLGIANGLACAPFCTEVGGNSTNPVGDYYYVPSASTVNTVLLLGGYTNDGAHGGAFYGYWGSTAWYSGWNFSARPSLQTP